MTDHHSRAEVDTDAAARYAKQLVAHLGRKITFTTDGTTSTAAIDTATATITVTGRGLILSAHGPDPDAVARAEHILGSHLERFGQRHELTVTWTRIREG
jgi:hypothetical protein